jgi:hypothetical protein
MKSDATSFNKKAKQDGEITNERSEEEINKIRQSKAKRAASITPKISKKELKN